jgi:putative oxygen-independent coproporphyrinogen III oxidase
MTTVTIALPSREPVIAFAALPPLSLYVHIPWCVRKCPYCDFNSHEARGELPERRYAQALMVDLERALPSVWGRRVHTVFFGGGTPSLFSAKTLDEILSGIRARVPLDPDAEVTLEANPGTFESDKFAEFKRLGINRLSIGVQSFNARHLKALGRIHDDHEARRAIEIARANFDNINLDLMYGLPEQALLEAEADISAAVEFAPQHISAYHLTVEPNTYFHRYPPPLPDEHLASDMQETIESLLAEHGYDHYETSAFARPGYQSRHNSNYWLFGDYLGIGAGAHSKVSFRDRIVRQVRWKQPREYLERVAAEGPLQQENAVPAAEVPFEFMMNALRLTRGFPARLFEERTGLPLRMVARELDEAERQGLLTRTHTEISPSVRGQRFLNDLLQLFLREQ